MPKFGLRRLLKKQSPSADTSAISIIDLTKELELLIKQGKFGEVITRGEIIPRLTSATYEQRLAGQILVSLAMNRNGEHKKGIEISQELLKEAQQLNNPVLIIDATISLVEAMRRMGMLNESLELIQKAEQHIGAVTSLNTRDILERKAILKNFKGIIYWTTGLLSESLENFQNSLTIREELGDERDIAVCLNNIGNIHTYKGELDLALDVYKQALTIREKLGNIRDIGSSIGNIALLYQYKADFDKSLHYWMQGKKIFEQIGNTFFLANTLYYIINLYMEHDKVDQVSAYMSELQALKEKEDSKMIDLRYRMASALVYKSSNRLLHKFKAADIFEQISSEKIIEHDFTVSATLNLCDLLLLELRLSGNEKALDEVKELAKRLDAIAKMQNSSSLAAQTYLLQAKLALLDLDIDLAKRLLIQGQTIAEEKGLSRLAFKISLELDTLIGQTEKWEELINRNGSMIERLELTQLERTIYQMILKREEINIPELSQEEPVLLFILLTSGIALFSHRFRSETTIDDQIIGAFISAINSFSQQLFATTGSIERVKYADFTLFTKIIEPFIFCYAFKGHSYLAMKKFTSLIESINKSKLVWSHMVDSVDYAKGLSIEDASVIVSLIKEHFYVTVTK